MGLSHDETGLGTVSKVGIELFYIRSVIHWLLIMNNLTTVTYKTIPISNAAGISSISGVILTLSILKITMKIFVHRHYIASA